MRIIKIPGINGLGKTGGCEKSPEVILNKLEEIFSNEQGSEVNLKKLDLDEVNLGNSDLEKDNKLIYKKGVEVFKKKGRSFFIGGDHSISYSIGKSFLDRCIEKRKEPCLIVFDAHPDCMEPMREPTHEEWLRALVESGFPPENILLVGVRNSWKSEIDFMKKNNIKVMKMNSIVVDLEECCDTLMEFARGKSLYVSIDIDAIDPVFAPATGYGSEVGGFTSREFLYIISRINKMKNLKWVDLVEINSEKDKKFNGMTCKLGAKILSEFL